MLNPVKKNAWLPFQPALLAHGVKRGDAAQGLPKHDDSQPGPSEKKKWIGISYTFPRESLCFEDLEKKHVFVILTHTHTQIASDFQHICRYQISSGAISKPCGSCPARAAFKGKPIGTSWHKPSAGDSSHRSKWFVFKIRTFTMIWHQKWSSTQRCLGLLGCLAFDFCILSY